MRFGLATKYHHYAETIRKQVKQPSGCFTQHTLSHRTNRASFRSGDDITPSNVGTEHLLISSNDRFNPSLSGLCKPLEVFEGSGLLADFLPIIALRFRLDSAPNSYCHSIRGVSTVGQSMLLKLHNFSNPFGRAKFFLIYLISNPFLSILSNLPKTGFQPYRAVLCEE